MICVRCLTPMKYEHGEYFCPACGLITDVVGSYTRESYQLFFDDSTCRPCQERTIPTEFDGEPNLDPEEEDY